MIIAKKSDFQETIRGYENVLVIVRPFLTPILTITLTMPNEVTRCLHATSRDK